MLFNEWGEEGFLCSFCIGVVFVLGRIDLGIVDDAFTDSRSDYYYCCCCYFSDPAALIVALCMWEYI